MRPTQALVWAFAGGSLALSIAGCTEGSVTPQAGPPIEETVSVSSEPAPQQAVLIHVAAPANPEEFGLDLIEDPLYEVLDNASVGELDGNEIGPDGAVIYLYGPDADRLFAAIEPALGSAPIPAGSYAVKRYGAPGARETRVPLR